MFYYDRGGERERIGENINRREESMKEKKERETEIERRETETEGQSEKRPRQKKQREKRRRKNRFCFVDLFNGISTFYGVLLPKFDPSINVVIITIFSIFHCSF